MTSLTQADQPEAASGKTPEKDPPAKKAAPRATAKAGAGAPGKGRAVAPAKAASVVKKALPAAKASGPRRNGTSSERQAVAPAPGAPAKKKAKLVRDSFTMPKADFDLIDRLKERALGFKQSPKKSELLRAGLHALDALSDARLKAVLGNLTALKAGRPKKQG